MNDTERINAITDGFKTIRIEQRFKDEALENLKQWITDKQYAEYVPQIDYLIEVKNWDLLLDCFYQTIPFGTAGRRGAVGIGPNRINSWTLMDSAQGHSQYMISKYGKDAKQRGIVIAYDVRQYLRTDEYDVDRLNPVYKLDCKTLATQLATVYAANNIKVYIFSDFTSTPELSFMVRHLKAVSGTMISASHNPPEFNGQKVMDEHGGQLPPPHDEELVNMVVNQVKEIKEIDFDEAVSSNKIVYVQEKDHRAYIEATKKISLGNYRSAKILFSPYHGTTPSSVMPVMEELEFDVIMDPVSGKPDPMFSSIMFNIPNPEVEESYLGLIDYANQIEADVIITADPDGDRCGLMSKEGDDWRFMNGNEILILTAGYVLEERKLNGDLQESNLIVETQVSTSMLSVLAEEYNVQIKSDLLVGFKYVANEMNKLEEEGRSDDLIIGGEESNGLTIGKHIREKDSAIAGVLIGELVSKLKTENKTLGEYLDELYSKFGYFRNYLTEIRILGAEGMSKMAKIQAALRERKPKIFGRFEVEKLVDRWDGDPFLSQTDKVSRDQLIFYFKIDDDTRVFRVTVRPSGTEPKIKFYFEIGHTPQNEISLKEEKKSVEEIKDEIEKEVLKYCYKIIGIDFPDRGFLLFWMLPAMDKLKYFEIEPEIEALIEVEDLDERKTKLFKLLVFLGVDPIEKVDRAFVKKNGKGILEYLGLA